MTMLTSHRPDPIKKMFESLVELDSHELYFKYIQNTISAEERINEAKGDYASIREKKAEILRELKSVEKATSYPGFRQAI